MIVVITQPFFFEGEAAAIADYLESGRADRVHLRKPGAGAAELERLLRQLPAACLGRMVMHEHFELAGKYGLCGIHLNRRCPEAPPSWTKGVSVSCHSLEELALRRREAFDYLSLSPVFDSISKPGYQAAFSAEVLEDARRQGLIDSRVLALGGVTFDRVPEVLAMGFGGAMILGDAWKSY